MQSPKIKCKRVLYLPPILFKFAHICLDSIHTSLAIQNSGIHLLKLNKKKNDDAIYTKLLLLLSTLLYIKKIY